MMKVKDLIAKLESLKDWQKELPIMTCQSYIEVDCDGDEIDKEYVADVARILEYTDRVELTS